MFDHIPLVQQPHNLKTKLFPHQLASIYKMEKIEENNFIEKEDYIKETKIAINASQTGSGKSAEMIGLMCRDKMEWDIETPYVFKTVHTEARGIIKNHFVSRYDKLSCNLLLVSPSIVRQWVKEVEKSTLKYWCFFQNKDVDLIDVDFVNNYDLIIVTPNLYNTLVSRFTRYAFKRFIFDEPSSIKVASMKVVQAGFYWLITATPGFISHIHRHCKTSFMKDIVGSSYYNDFDTHINDLIIRNDPNFIKMSFEMPPTIHVNHECFQPIYHAVRSFISPMISTMIEAGNIEGAIIALGGEKTGNIVELIKAKKLEELEIAESKIRIYTMRNDTEHIEEWTAKKDEILKKIDELDDKFKELLNSPCNICFDELSSPILEPHCQNLFCGNCLLTWLNMRNTCPLCRHVISLEDLVYIKDGGEDEEKVESKVEKMLTKDEKIVDIISKNPEGLFIIFSEYDNTFNSITKILNENCIKFVQIKGNINTRVKNLELFKKGDIKVVFLNSRFNGSGLNIQEATDIILYHQMHELIQNQVLGRANRIGRMIPLTVHHLL